MSQIQKPSKGILVTTGSGDTILAVRRFNLYDFEKKEIVAVSNNIYGNLDHAEFLGMVNAISYALKHGIESVYTDSKTALKEVMDKKVYEPPVESSAMLNQTVSRCQKAQKFLESLWFNYGNYQVNNEDNLVYLRNWLFSMWGDPPTKELITEIYF